VKELLVDPLLLLLGLVHLLLLGLVVEVPLLMQKKKKSQKE